MAETTIIPPNTPPAPTDSGLEIAAQHAQLPEGFMPQQQFAQLPKEVRHRLIEAERDRRALGEMRGEVDGLKTGLRNLQQAPPAPAANGNGHAAPPDRIAQMSLAELQANKQRVYATMIEAAAADAPEDKRALVRSAEFIELANRLDLEVARKAAAEAVDPLKHSLEANGAAQNVAYSLATELTKKYGRSTVMDAENPINKRATTLKEQLIAERGVDPNDPAQAWRVHDLTLLAYSEASRELVQRSATAPRPMTPAAGGGSPSGAFQNDEVTALIAQGRTSEAHAVARKLFREKGITHPAFSAKDRII